MEKLYRMDVRYLSLTVMNRAIMVWDVVNVRFLAMVKVAIQHVDVPLVLHAIQRSISADAQKENV